MKAKHHRASVLQGAVFSVFVLVVATAMAQSIPSKLSGRWTTVDGAASAATSKGTLTVWSSSPECTIRDAAITVTASAEKLVLKVDSSYSNPCRSDVSVELTKKPGTDEYEGELRQGGPAGARFPILRVKMSP